MDRGAWWAAVHGIAKSQTGVSDLTLSHFHHRISLIFVCVCVCLCVCVCVCVCTQSYPTLHNTFGLQSARLLCPQNFSGKNTRVGCHFLLQGIFPTQGLKLCCLHYRQIFTAEPLEKALTNLDHFKFYLIILALCIIQEVILIVIFTYSSLRLNCLLNSFSYIHSHRETYVSGRSN